MTAIDYELSKVKAALSVVFAAQLVLWPLLVLGWVFDRYELVLLAQIVLLVALVLLLYIEHINGRVDRIIINSLREVNHAVRETFEET